MKKIQKILFPTDFSDTAMNAFRYTVLLADQLDATIELLHVVYPQAEPLDFPVLATQATQQQVSAAESIMKKMVAETLAQIQVDHELKNAPVILPEVEIGTPTGLICRVAERDEVDMVVMGTKGEHSMMEKAFGQVSLGTIKNAPIPVLLVPEMARFSKINTVAYASNLMETDVFYIWQTLQLLESFHPILRVVHVDTDDKEHAVNLEEFKALFEGNPKALQINFHELHGKAVADELNGFIATWDIDMMVLYAPRHGFIERLFHQSVGKKLAMTAEVPLLFLKKATA
ncbi:MAG: universal stress protein [Saprospiraceae bacterium]